jgi:hypothetical protein
MWSSYGFCTWSSPTHIVVVDELFSDGDSELAVEDRVLCVSLSREAVERCFDVRRSPRMTSDDARIRSALRRSMSSEVGIPGLDPEDLFSRDGLGCSKLSKWMPLSVLWCPLMLRD